LATGDQHGNVVRWSLSDRRPVWTFTPKDGVDATYSVAISPDGRFVAHSNGVSDSSDGHLVYSFYLPQKIGEGQFYGVAFSPDGQKLVGVTTYSDVIIWSTSTWQVIGRASLPGSTFICVRFAPDSKYLVTGEDEGFVRLWNWSGDGLRNVGVIGRHVARIKSVDFSPDGREIVSSGDDQTIALWDMADRKLITNLGTHTAPVLGVSFGPDGKHIASAGQDKSVRIYTRHHRLWGYNLD
jgi:WD40 repeat protein